MELSDSMISCCVDANRRFDIRASFSLSGISYTVWRKVISPTAISRRHKVIMSIAIGAQNQFKLQHCVTLKNRSSAFRRTLTPDSIQSNE